MSITREERLKWWHEARFGMFIHWGLYAIPAGEWKGEKIPGIGEWIMRNAKIPIAEYEELAKDFNPVKFDAEEWAEVAHQAGMKYLVITAKHHDGFCMFDSPSNPYNIVNATPFRRDPMKELAEACNKRGIRMCFYYSQAQDWHAPGGAGHWEERGDGPDWLSYARPAEDFQKYLDDVVKPNLRELLTHYGPIGLIWFDTPVAITKEQSEDLRDYVHELQPECLVSGRVGHGVGDYGSLGDNQHPTGAVKDAWETPATLNDTWGFKTDDHNWKSLDYLLDLLVNCASKGVNYLLNVGPTAEGIIPQPSVDLLKQVGDWLKRNGEAIYGTSASPFPLDPAWGRVTVKGETIYLLIKEWPESGRIKLPGLRNEIRGVRVLGDQGSAASARRDDDFIVVELPQKAPERIVSVVALDLDGAADVERRVIQEDDRAVYLPVHVADIEGSMKVEPAGITTGWKDTGSSASWKVRIKTPGTYKVCVLSKVHRKLMDQYGTPEMRVTINGEAVAGTIQDSGLDMSEAARVYQVLRKTLGELSIAGPGDCDVRIVADKVDPGASRGINLVALELEPVN